MQQLLNVIRVDENGASVPYLVLERISEFASPKLRAGYKLIREQKNNEVYFLVCKPITDADWSDIPTEDATKGYKGAATGSNVDTKA